MRTAWVHGEESGVPESEAAARWEVAGGDQQPGARTASVSLVGSPETTELCLATGMPESQKLL